MERTIENVPLGSDTIVFVLQNLRFIIHKGKSCMEPKQVIDFPSFILNYNTLAIYLPKEKIEKVGSHFEKVLYIMKVA